MKKYKTFTVELDFSKVHNSPNSFDYFSEQIDIGKRQLNKIKQNYIERLEEKYNDVIFEVITPLFYFEVDKKHYLEEKIKVTTGEKI